MQTAFALFVLCLAAWPLFYALLQSYVPQWDGVMCIYGVTRIGEGAAGASGWLPRILSALQITKPAIIFVGGACLTIFVVQRRLCTVASMRSMFVGLMVFGILSFADSSLEAAYLLIPKTGQSLEAGCCTTSADSLGSSATTESKPISSHERRYIAWAHFGLCAALIGLVGRRALFTRQAPSFTNRLFRIEMAVAVLGAVFSLPLGWWFLYEVAAPAILGLPFHRCPYDLLPLAPESITAVIAHLLAAFLVGWAAIAALASCFPGRSEPSLSPSGDALAKKRAAPAEVVVQRLLFLSGAAYFVAVLVMALELWLLR